MGIDYREFRLYGKLRRKAIDLAAYWQRKGRLNICSERVDFTGDLGVDAQFLIGTGTGLLLYQNGHLRRVIEGRFYGLTYAQNRWYAFRLFPIRVFGWEVDTLGHIISFELVNGDVTHARVETMLHPGTHQIDAAGKHLFVTDTANNRLVRYDVSTQGLTNKVEAYPAGSLPTGKASSNYVHLNSVYCTPHKIYLVYHNQSRNTGRPSEIVELNSRMQVTQRRETPAQCAHNIVPTRRGLLYCDSLGGRLMLNDQAVFSASYFLRGLAVADSFCLVGGSNFNNRSDRDQADGYVFARNRDTFGAVGEMMIPGCGSVYEIRLIEPVDYGMSNNFVQETPAVVT